MLISLSHTRLWIHVFLPSSSHFTSMKWCNTTVHYSQLFYWKIKIDAPQIMLLIRSRVCFLSLPSLSGVSLCFLAVTWQEMSKSQACLNVSEIHFSAWIFSFPAILMLPFDKGTLPLQYKDTSHMAQLLHKSCVFISALVYKEWKSWFSVQSHTRMLLTLKKQLSSLKTHGFGPWCWKRLQ